MVVLVPLLYIRSYSGVIEVSFLLAVGEVLYLSRLRHFWHSVVAEALEGPPIVGPLYRFIALKDLSQSYYRAFVGGRFEEWFDDVF